MDAIAWLFEAILWSIVMAWPLWLALLLAQALMLLSSETELRWLPLEVMGLAFLYAIAWPLIWGR